MSLRSDLATRLLMLQAADQLEELVAERRAAEAEIERLRASLERADGALQQISLMLGGDDEWASQESMIADVLRMVEERMEAHERNRFHARPSV